MSLERVLSLQAVVRVFHVCKVIWEPKDSEVLACSHEENNAHDPFAIKTCRLDSGRIVGHLPMELSRISKFIIDRGAKIEVKLRETHYRRSPLVEGGLEIPCDLVIRMPNTMKSAESLKKYLKLFENCYEEPQEILGTFSSKSVGNIRGNEKNNSLRRKESTSPVANSKSTGEKERKKQRGIAKSHDIKSMFKNAANKRKAPKENEDDSVVILD